MKTINWIQLLLGTFIICLGLFSSIYEKKELETCSFKTEAKVIDVYAINKRGNFFKYEYYVETVKYESTESLTGNKNILLGDTISISISCSSPNISKFIIESN